jgi:hypothetical protein
MRKHPISRNNPTAIWAWTCGENWFWVDDDLDHLRHLVAALGGRFMEHGAS